MGEMGGEMDWRAVEETLKRSARTILAAAPVLPQREDLGREIADAEAAQARGYYEPVEDERLMNGYARYLGVRAALWGAVDTLIPLIDSEEGLDWGQRLRAFGLGFCAAAKLLRAAVFVVEVAGAHPVVWKRLDEAEPRYGIDRKSFTAIYRNLASTRVMWRCHEAARFYEVHREDLETAMDVGLFRRVLDLLREEEPLMAVRSSDYVKRGLKYRLFDFQRRNRSGYRKVMFHLFELSGRAIAEMKQPFVKPAGAGKRVTAAVREQISGLLRPGDVFVTRHDDAMSNLFLPGFWPHAALYIGPLEERELLGVEMDEQRRTRSGGTVRFLEAKKDGVRFRPMEETLAVDAFTVLRPVLAPQDLAGVLGKALTHEGKFYDFAFDFRGADRLACTELVYRCFHGTGAAEFVLHTRSGRMCLSAEDLLRQALGSGAFEVLALYGVGENRMWTGRDARERLAQSL
jgi:hypothetical protein